MDKYISISEAVTTYNKSESTIRSLVRKIGNKKGLLKKEKLPNGSNKIFISVNYLDSIFKEKPPIDHIVIDTSTTNTQTELIELLKHQLEEKDKQIESLLERNRESNILLSQLQNKVLLIDEKPTKKRRWWRWRS